MLGRNFGCFSSVPASAATLFLILCVASTPGLACGTIRDWTTKYTSPSATDHQRLSALRELAALCGDYAGKKSDIVLFDILRDAATRGYGAKLIQPVFDTYRCLSGVRRDPAYRDLAAGLDTSRCPTEDDLKRWYTVTVDSANIRAEPTISAVRVDWLWKGAVVEKLGTSGEWLKIKTWTNQEGYVHASLLARY